MSAQIMITGPLGNVGAEVVNCLQSQGVPVRAAHRSPEAVHERFGDSMDAGVDSVLFDFTRPETFADAVRGIQRLFLMRPPQITDVKKYLFPLIDAARDAGVEQIVFLSLIGIEQNQQVPHYAVEEYLVESKLPYTFLRAGFFMQNLNTTHQEEIRDRDELFVPVGDGKTAFVDVRDIAAVAALALTQEGHEHKAYDLTGSEALDYYQVADLFSRILGRQIVYRNPSALRFLWRQIRTGTPLPFALVMTWLYSSTRKGMAERVTDEVAQLLGRPPISLEQYVNDYRDAWV